MKSKHDQICKKCGEIIKGATREKGGVSSVYVHYPVKKRGFYHFKCRYNGKKGGEKSENN